MFFRIFLGLLFPKLEFPKGGKFVFGLPQVLLAFGVLLDSVSQGLCRFLLGIDGLLVRAFR